MKNWKLYAVAMWWALFVPAGALYAAGTMQLDRAPDRTADLPALQRGARLFVNYCLSCHSASAVRYSRMTELGLKKEQIIDNLIFSHGREGSPMVISMEQRDGREWFGVPPPDLSIIVRARGSEAGSGADWLYTYLRSFYRDPARPSGWNNLVFQNVAMPHVLWQLQGEQMLEQGKLKLVRPGSMNPQAYDQAMGDLTGFLTWMSEPNAQQRRTLGVWVLLALVGLLVLTYRLKKEYWKDVH